MIYYIPPSVIYNFIKDLVIGKTAGPDNLRLTAEYPIYAHKNLSALFGTDEYVYLWSSRIC